MPQISPRATNTLSKVSIFGAVFVLTFVGWVFYVHARSSYATDAGVARVQPIPFSHEHHTALSGRLVETNLIQNMEMEIGAGGQTVKFKIADSSK